MGRTGEQFLHWAAEWNTYALDRGGQENWALFRYTTSHVRERAHRYLRTDDLSGLRGLAYAIGARGAQDHRITRCWYFLGAELDTLHQWGGTWKSIANTTCIADSTVKRMVKTFEKEPPPGRYDINRDIDEDLTALIDRVPGNPFRRICELVAAWRFHTDIADAFDSLIDRLLTELDDTGVSRAELSRRSGFAPATLTKRIDRHRRGQRQASTGSLLPAPTG